MLQHCSTDDQLLFWGIQGRRGGCPAHFPAFTSKAALWPCHIPRHLMSPHWPQALLASPLQHSTGCWLEKPATEGKHCTAPALGGHSSHPGLMAAAGTTLTLLAAGVPCGAKPSPAFIKARLREVRNFLLSSMGFKALIYRGRVPLHNQLSVILWDSQQL